MGNSQIKTMWECGSCYRLHNDEDDAYERCRPSVSEVFICPACDKAHSEHDKAAQCCGFDVMQCPCCARDYGGKHINVFAIHIAGHCNTCNPHFTVERQLAIEDMHIADGADWNAPGLLS